MLSRASTSLALDVNVDVATALRRIETFTAVVRSVVVSPGWRHDEPLIGELDGRRFALRVRHGYSNGLTRILRGEVVERSGGARIDGAFGTLGWVVWILRGIWALNLAFALFAVRAGAPQLALFPVLVVGFVMGVEAFGRHLGDRDEETIRRTFARAFADARKA